MFRELKGFQSIGAQNTGGGGQAETNDLHLHRARVTKALNIYDVLGTSTQIRPSQACYSKYGR